MNQSGVYDTFERLLRRKRRGGFLEGFIPFFACLFDFMKIRVVDTLAGKNIGQRFKNDQSV